MSWTSRINGVFIVWHCSIERGNDNSYSQKGSEINSVPFLKFWGIIMVLKSIGGTHNNPVFKWPAYWIWARETHVPYGREQRNKYSITYGNVISALSGFGHILKHLLQDQCIHQNMLSVSFGCVLILQMLSWPHIQAYY